MSREAAEAQAVREMAEEIAEFAASLRRVRTEPLELSTTQEQQLWARAVSLEEWAREPRLARTVACAAAQVAAATPSTPPLVPLTRETLQNATGLLRDAALANARLGDAKVVRLLDACWDAGCGPWRLSCVGAAALREQGGVMVTARAIAAAVVARGAAHTHRAMAAAFRTPAHLELAAAVYCAADGDAACRTLLVQALLCCADACAAAPAAPVPCGALAPLLAAAEACPLLCAALAPALATVACMHGAAHPLVRDAAAHAGPALAARLAALRAARDSHPETPAPETTATFG